jgi:uncharacterized RDD family membrane protein YckC
MAEPSGPRASFFQRFAAAIIDGIIIAVVNFILGLVLNQNAASLASLVIGVAYYATQEGGPTGQTIGKRVLGIRVVKLNGGELGIGGGVLRYVGRIPSALVCGLGYFWALWDDEKQTWHDKIAGTVVVPADAVADAVA